MRVVGVMSRDGEGVTQDYKEAVKWFRKAAEQGNTHFRRKIFQIMQFF